jgi:hypothetical protein
MGDRVYIRVIDMALGGLRKTQYREGLPTPCTTPVAYILNRTPAMNTRPSES